VFQLVRPVGDRSACKWLFIVKIYTEHVNCGKKAAFSVLNFAVGIVNTTR